MIPRHCSATRAFEARQELHLVELRDELQSRSYHPSPSACFVTTRPKLREILAADFRDRVVHHLLIGAIEPDWERVFIHDSYACRRGKGVHQAVDRLQTFLLRATANGTREAWYLQLDIADYFMSIDKALLWARLARRIRDPDVAWLTELLVFHDCTDGALYRGHPGMLDRIPAHKSLFHCPPGKGLPIGNLNSQFFANVYLDRLDQFVKHTLKCSAYLRYCDDFVLVARDPARLRAWRDAIEVFVREELLLALNPARERLRPVSDGVDFLGYVVRPHYRLARRRVVNRMHDRLATFERAMVREVTLPGPALRMDHECAHVDALQATLASYLGHLRWAATRRLVAGLAQRHPFLCEHFRIDATAYRIERRIAHRCPARRVKDQYAWWRRKFRKDVVFFQVRRYVEFYQTRDAQIGKRHSSRALFAALLAQDAVAF